MSDEALDEKAIFHLALSLKEPAERQALLVRLCNGDVQLRARVEGLLAAHEYDGELFEQSAAELEAGATKSLASQIVGTTIGRYKILEQIGEGGFGIVYMAEQQQPIQRRVALKIIKAGMDTTRVISRFEAERQALALMDHPYIAKVFDAGSTDSGRPYFVMELVRGIPATEFCDQFSLSIEERLNLFVQICTAIQHAHQKGIIHRDIKPSNILCAYDGEEPVVKVIDFGIAKATQGRLTDKTLFTQFRELIGTPSYMSPEQAQMTAIDVDTRSDIYSLGVLLYELLTGTTPFDTQKLQEIGLEELCRQIREVEPATPSMRLTSLSLDEKTTTSQRRGARQFELMHTIRGELDWIAMKAIEKDRRRRYESADALKLDVQRFLANEPVSAAAPSTIYRASKFVQRNKKAIFAATLFGALLSAGAIISTWQAIYATRQASRLAAAENTARENLNLARENELASRRHQYAAEMIVAQSSASGLSSENVYELLKRQIPGPNEPDLRGFEWRRLWHNYRRELFSLKGHTDEIRDVAMSSDGRLLVSGSNDGTARLWDVTARQQIWMFEEGEYCNRVAFSPDGRLLLTKWPSEAGDGQNILWDISSPTRPARLRNLESFGRFSPDGKSVVSDGEPLKQWNLETGEVLHEYSDPALDGTEFAGRSHQGRRETMSFSADGRRLLTVGEDRTVKLWDTSNGSLIVVLATDTHFLDGAFSPLDATIAAVSVDSELTRIWNSEGKELRTIQFDSPVDRVRFSSDGKKMVVSQFGRLHVFDTQSWEELAVFDSRSSLDALKLCSPIDANIAVTNSSTDIRLWDISSKETVLDHALPVRALEYSNNGKFLAVGMANGAVQLWDVAQRSAIRTTPETRSIGPKFRERPTLTPYKPGFVQFSPDDKTFAVMGPPNTIRIWHIDEQEPPVVITISRNDREIKSLSFSPNGESLYAGTFGQGVLVWDLSQPDQQPTTLDHPGDWSVDSLAWTPNQDLLASGRLDVKLWSPPDHQAIRSLDMSSQPKSLRGATSLDFSPCGKWLAGGTLAGSVWLWDTRSWTHEVLPIIGYVMSVDFSPDGKRLVAADMGSTVKMWDVESRRTVATFKGSIAEFSPDGNTLAVGSESRYGSMKMPEAGRVRLYYAPPPEK